MMQVVSNMMNLFLSRPGNAEYIMFIGQKISNFKIIEEENVQQWIKVNIFDNNGFLKAVILG